MDAHNRCTNLGKKILPIVLSSMVDAKNLSDHPRTSFPDYGKPASYVIPLLWRHERLLNVIP